MLTTEVDLLQLAEHLEPQQYPLCTSPPTCTFLDPEVIKTTLDGLNYMTGLAKNGKAVEPRHMPITYIEGEAGLGKSAMAINLHQGMQDMCQSPEGQLMWPHAAKLLNDPGDAGQKVWLLEVFADEFQLIQEQAARFNLSNYRRERISKTLVYELGYFAAQDVMACNSPLCGAARHGMVLLPGFFGTALGAISRYALPTKFAMRPPNAAPIAFEGGHGAAPQPAPQHTQHAP
ncbi:hypothetical protein WJX74_007008 [Apatococcus lobatus]|uniref:Uncharacterized protein n=1 Tax=Apatococcus lobatus TaxID=904363 RepID=A0AAW1Q229_9CHLO